MVVASTVALTAMIRLLIADWIRSLSASAERYQVSENLSQTVNFDELKLKMAKISSGRCKNAYAAMA